MEQTEIERYVKAAEAIGRRVSDPAVISAIITELGKDARMREMRRFETQDVSRTVSRTDAPASEKQLALIRALGGSASEGLTRAEASAMIDRLRA
ncbi:MAG: hypothetical protein SF069_11755 [Phycisphaerae bacterium]|nr:hypothetical protein [Phycisphaerae bacterium]